jgi:hypothetical protein
LQQGDAAANNTFKALVKRTAFVNNNFKIAAPYLACS